MKTALKELTASDLTQSALDELRWRGFECWRQNQVKVPGRKFTGKRGLTDIQGYDKLTGIALYCEVKTIGDTIKIDQYKFLQGAKKAGCHVKIATQDKETGQFVMKDF